MKTPREKVGKRRYKMAPEGADREPEPREVVTYFIEPQPGSARRRRYIPLWRRKQIRRAQRKRTFGA
jgi:hypothetical protein